MTYNVSSGTLSLYTTTTLTPFTGFTGLAMRKQLLYYCEHSGVDLM